jgi:hypothetical protein
VPGACRVGVAYLDEQGEPQFVEASGWYARIPQHEIDHLRGALYKALDAPTFRPDHATMRLPRILGFRGKAARCKIQSRPVEALRLKARASRMRPPAATKVRIVLTRSQGAHVSLTLLGGVAMFQVMS